MTGITEGADELFGQIIESTPSRPMRCYLVQEVDAGSVPCSATIRRAEECSHEHSSARSQLFLRCRSPRIPPSSNAQTSEAVTQLFCLRTISFPSDQQIVGSEIVG